MEKHRIVETVIAHLTRWVEDAREVAERTDETVDGAFLAEHLELADRHLCDTLAEHGLGTAPASQVALALWEQTRAWPGEGVPSAREHGG